MKAWIGAIALAGVLGSGASMAHDGNVLIEECESAVRKLDNVSMPSDSDLNSGVCFGTVQGVGAMMVYLNSELSGDYKACFPTGGVSNAQGARVVLKYLRDNPANLHKDGPFLVVLALHKAFPCKK
jgi:hypothetical protein